MSKEIQALHRTSYVIVIENKNFHKKEATLCLL